MQALVGRVGCLAAQITQRLHLVGIHQRDDRFVHVHLGAFREDRWGRCSNRAIQIPAIVDIKLDVGEGCLLAGRQHHAGSGAWIDGGSRPLNAGGAASGEAHGVVATPINRTELEVAEQGQGGGNVDGGWAGIGGRRVAIRSRCLKHLVEAGQDGVTEAKLNIEAIQADRSPGITGFPLGIQLQVVQACLV